MIQRWGEKLEATTTDDHEMIHNVKREIHALTKSTSKKHVLWGSDQLKWLLNGFEIKFFI